MKVALCEGINIYPNPANNLWGAGNDSRDWGEFLSYKEFQVEYLHDKKATIYNTVKKLYELSQNAEILVWQFSGHGSTVADLHGDEPDGRDECLCLYDGILIDDEIRKIIQGFKGRFIFVSDSCNSGDIGKGFEVEYKKSKFIPSEKTGKPIRRFLRTLDEETKENEIILSACKSNESAIDGYFWGRSNGVFSFYSLEILNRNPKQSYKAYWEALRVCLPSPQYKQTPQISINPNFWEREIFS